MGRSSKTTYRSYWTGTAVTQLARASLKLEKWARLGGEHDIIETNMTPSILDAISQSSGRIYSTTIRHHTIIFINQSVDRMIAAFIQREQFKRASKSYKIKFISTNARRDIITLWHVLQNNGARKTTMSKIFAPKPGAKFKRLDYRVVVSK